MSPRKKAVRKPRKKKKVTRRSRDHVLPKDMDRVLKAALASATDRGTGRHGLRNYTLMLLCFRHGLRISELKQFRWRQVDLKRKVLRVTRIMNGINSVQPLRGLELVALRKLKRKYPDGPYLFVKSRGKTMSSRTISRIVAEAGVRARLKYHLSPGMLRRGCGYALANAGHSMVALQHYLGHRNIRHTQRYMTLPDKPFKNFWKD